MPEKASSRSLLNFFRSNKHSTREGSQGTKNGDHRAGTANASPFISAKSVSEPAKSSLVPTTTEVQPPKQVTSSPDLVASSVRKPATSPSTEHPPSLPLIPPVAATTPRAQEASSVKVLPAIPIEPEQLWDQAYDDLKHDNPKLIELYETILSPDLDNSSKGAKGNVIEQKDRTKRRSQMESLLNTGLDKTEKLAKVEKNIGDAINIVLSVKEAIGSALQAVPIAALAWTGVCVALQVSLPFGIHLLALTVFVGISQPNQRGESESRRNYRGGPEDEMVLQPVEAPSRRDIRARRTLRRTSRLISESDSQPVQGHS